MIPSTQRPTLDEHDFKTVRELYTQSQLWARHYETLMVSTNVLLVTAASVFSGLALRDDAVLHRVFALFGVPVLMSVVGIFLTRTLFKLCALCIERLIAYENALNCFDSSKLVALPWGGSLVPAALMRLPVRMPASARFFVGLHLLLVITYVLLVVFLR